MTDRGSRRVALASAVTANFGQFGARVAISPFVIAIAATFATSKATVGLVLTGMWAVFALSQFPSGILADRYGERRIILVALGLSVVGSVLVALSPSLVVFALAALVLGSGTGLYFAPGTALLDRRFRDTGVAFGAHSAGAPLAGVAVPVVAAVVAARADWRAGVLVGGATAFGALVLSAVGLERTDPGDPTARLRDRVRPGVARDLLARPSVAFATALSVAGMYVFQSFVSFFPTFLQEYHHLDRGTASLATGIAFLLIAAGLPLVGRAADRVDRDASLAVPFLVTAVGFGLLIALPRGSRWLWGAIVLVGAGMTWGGAIQSRVMREFAPHERGTGFGLVRTVFVLLGSVGNVATGVLAQAAGWPVAYGVLVGLLVVGATLVVGNRVLGLGL